MKESSDWHCRVCGWFLEEPPWTGATPTFLTCPCCGVEFGYQDFTPLGATRYRNLWLEAGARWQRPRERPTNWNLEAQLKSVPLDFIAETDRSPATAL